MTGRKYIYTSHGRITMEKQFGTRPVPFALQATVKVGVALSGVRWES